MSKRPPKIRTPRDERLRRAIVDLAAEDGAPDALARLVAEHPDLATDLRAAAVEIVAEHAREAVPEAAAPHAEGGVVDIARRAFEDRVASLAREKEDPFHALDVTRTRALARELRVDALLMAKLRDRLIAFESIPRRFIADLAAGLGRSVDEVGAFLAGPARVPEGAFKSRVQPRAGEKQSFVDAVKASGLAADDEAHVLRDDRES